MFAQSWLWASNIASFSINHQMHTPFNELIELFFCFFYYDDLFEMKTSSIYATESIYMIIVAWISQKTAFDFFCDCFFFHQRKQWETSAYKDKFVAILPRDKKNAEFIMRSCMFTSHKAHIYFETLYRTHFKYDLLFSCQSTIGQWPNGHTWRIYKIYQDCLKWNFNLTNFLSKNDLKKLIIFPWHATFHACTR